MVFTTKHHDGFCMFDSSYTDYKNHKTPRMARTSWRSCPQQPCRLRCPSGFYYSPPDMHHPPFRDIAKLSKDNWKAAHPTEWPLYLDYMQLQLTELLTNYGPAALIWFDGSTTRENMAALVL